MKNNSMPEIKGVLRSHMIELPKIISTASGIRVFGKRLKSFLFTTDIAIMRNNSADAVIAVYPFTPQPIITDSLIRAADVPVFCGVGGGITSGKRVVNLALDAEFKGAMGVVVNNPTPNEVITQMRESIDIPIIVTVVSEFEDIHARIRAGVSILNISGAKRTPDIIRNIRKDYPEFPIIATGGPNDDTIKETIDAGANAVTFTPPTCAEILNKIMNSYRDKYINENIEE